MMLDTLQQRIVATISAELGEKSKVSTHAGALNLKEMKGKTIALPAIRVVLMGCANIEETETGEMEAKARLAAFVVTKPQRGRNKADVSLELVEGLIALIPSQMWEMENVHPAEKVKAENLYNAQLDREGLSMWVITWEQVVILGEDVWSGGQTPSEFYLADDEGDFGQAPNYEQIK
ncbi:phage protein Gp37 [Algicola sagamiensis]|uniref:phage protein Gp37 n=1 Tax=Algicola sagamiensis TaxID=163869 RepID=UPI000363E161|nr:phage protein Gp37 [Algicola sagamiensis]